MALLRCPECKKKFSEHAQACPACGAPVTMALEARVTEKKNVKVVLVVAALFALWVVVTPKKETVAAAPPDPAAVARQKARDAELNEIKFQRVAREFVQASLRDASSAQFRNQKGFCGEVNSKNAFGGMAGFQRFIAADKDLVVLERDSGMAGREFAKVWNQVCK